MQEDMTLLMILEARDMASAVVRGLKRNLDELDRGQKIRAAAYIAGGVAALDIAKKTAQFVASGTRDALSFSSQMNLIATQAQASQKELKTMNDYLLANSAKWGVGADNLVRGLYNIESVGARAQKSLNGLHVTSKDLIKSTGQLQLIAGAGNPNGIDSQVVAKALLQPFTTGIITERVKGRAVHGFKSAQGAAGAINKVVGLGDMRMNDFLASLSSGFVANLQSEGFDWRSVMAAFDTLTDTGLPAQRAGVYLRQLGSNIVSARNKPKTEGLLSTIGLSGEKLQADIKKPGGMLTVIEDLRSHLKSSGRYGLVRGEAIAKAFGVTPKTKADLTADLQFLATHIDKMSKLAKEKLSTLLGTANRSTSMQNALGNLVGQIASGRGNTGWADSVLNQLLGGARTGAAGAILINEPTRFRDRYAALRNPGGRGDIAGFHKSFTDTLRSPQGEISQYHAAVKNLKIAIGEGILPLLAKLFIAMNKFLVPLTAWATKHKTLAAVIAVSIAVFFGIGAALLFAAAAAIAFDFAMSPILAIVVGVVAAFVLLAAGVYELVAHFGAIKKWFEKEWPWILDVVTFGAGFIIQYWSQISGFFGKLWREVYGLFVRYGRETLDLLVLVWNRAIAMAVLYWNDFKGWLGTLWRDIENDAITVWNDVVSFFSGIWSTISNDVVSAWNGIISWFAGLPGRILAAIGNAASWLYDVGKDALTGLWNGIVWVAENGPGYALEFAKWILGVIGSAASWLWGLGGDAAHGLWDGIKAALQATVSWAGQVGQWVTDAIGSPVGWLYDKGSNAASGLWSGVRSGLQATVSWIGQVGGWVANAIGSAASWLYGKGGDAADGLWNGLKAALNGTVSWAGQVGSWIAKALGNGSKWLTSLAHQIVNGFWKALLNAFQHPGKMIVALATALKNVFVDVWNKAKSLAGKAGGFIGKIAGDAAGAVGLGGGGSSSTPHNDTRQTQSAADPTQAIIAAVQQSQQAAEIALSAIQDAGGASNIHLAGVPLLAAGGIVTGPTLAVLGEAGHEAVIPLSQMGNLGGNTVIVDLTGAQFLDDASINRFIDKLGPALTRYVLPGAGIAIRR